jgi:biopolymer transport protein ExbD
MKFPRSARIFRGHLDVAPFASVFFLLVLFALLGALTYTPGIPVELQLPQADNLPGTDRPLIAVTVDAAGRFYYENQAIEESELKTSLRRAAKNSPEPMTLLVQADKQVAYDRLMRLVLLGRDAGITNALWATLPHVYPASSTPPSGEP